ncbi:MAG: DUF5103 domain-containing protein [Muribaculaceae bacterium]|nr:DUF5103 domain-containing protein [Muribaculaceae bacterium]MBQ7205662.1 DUF5103 domain-containing protein [Muribaculaceae bacterium]
MKQNRILGLLCCFIVALSSVAQNRVETRPIIFDSNVRSLKVCMASNMYMPPVLMMNSDDRLLINFDYLDYDVHYLRYSVTHCNADWQPSQLVESEYVSGFNYGDIEDYEPSEATYVHYYNYQFVLPNADMEFYVSGNYMLTVYEQDDPTKILFQTRFSLCEGTVSVFPQVTSRTDVEYNNRFQQVSFDIRYKPNQIQDPYSEFICVVSQNSRQDNAVTVTRPMMVGVDHVTYDHNKDLIFPAGNEFRRFETVSAHNLNMGVQSIRYYEPMYHAILRVDEPRNEIQYLYDKTQFGRFTIRNAEAFGENALQADYMITHFTLDTGGKLNGGNVWLYGEFLEGYSGSQAMMKYDDSSGCYTADLLLKQGAYNYMYLWVPDGTTVGQTGKIEGDHYETINEYLVKVYDRPMGERYDHFVGYGVTYSGR